MSSVSAALRDAGLTFKTNRVPFTPLRSVHSTPACVPKHFRC